MITPDKMSQLQNNEVVDLYAELNNKLTKYIIERIKRLGDLSKYSKSEIKTIIKREKRIILKYALKETRVLYKKSKKGIKSVYQELGDNLDNK